MRNILNVLGHTLVLSGVLIAVFAGAAFVLWEYLRLSGSSGRFRNLIGGLSRVRLLAISLGALPVMLIPFRSIGVEI
jgi:hypothetical protein